MSLLLEETQTGLSFHVADTVTTMQTAVPEAWTSMLEHNKRYTISDDGKQVISLRRGVAVCSPWWDAHHAGFLRLEPSPARSHASAAGYALGMAFAGPILSQPLSCEIPRDIINCIAADPESGLARKYYLFVRNFLLPRLREGSALIRCGQWSEMVH
eukprot:SAG31_NODE_615_length_13521_cov_43.196916_2_plen_157_part_00